MDDPTRSLPRPKLSYDQTTLDGLHLTQRDAVRVAARVADTRSTTLRFGGHTAELHAIGQGVADVFGPALAHNVVPAGAPAELTITAFSGDDADFDLNVYARVAIGGSHPWWLNSRREVVGLHSSDLFATFQWPVLSLYDPVAREAIWYVDSLDQLQVWDRSAPARSILHWWLNSVDHHLVHSAAVGRPEGAVLLTGRGGSGKSTLALSCIGSDLRYVGDDYCAITVAPEPRVVSLYNSGKMVGQDDLDRLPHLADWVVNPSELGDVKQLVYAYQIDPSAVLHDAPLKAIVLPIIEPGAAPRITPASKSDTLRALAPTSLFQLPGTGAEFLRAMADLTRVLPCYRLTVGPDLAANRSLLAEVLDESIG